MSTWDRTIDATAQTSLAEGLRHRQIEYVQNFRGRFQKVSALLEGRFQKVSALSHNTSLNNWSSNCGPCMVSNAKNLHSRPSEGDKMDTPIGVRPVGVLGSSLRIATSSTSKATTVIAHRRPMSSRRSSPRSTPHAAHADAHDAIHRIIACWMNSSRMTYELFTGLATDGGDRAGKSP